jgi:hypothetical protein
MRAFGASFDGDHVETQRPRAPFLVHLQEVSSGADDLALLAPAHRRKRSAKIALGALTNFDDEQQLILPGDDVQFAGTTAQVAGKHLSTSPLQMTDGEGFAIQATSHAWVGHEFSMQVAALTSAW